MGIAYVPPNDAAAHLPIEDVLKRFETPFVRSSVAKPSDVSTVIDDKAAIRQARTRTSASIRRRFQSWRAAR
jgi:hypothetical protein